MQEIQERVLLIQPHPPRADLQVALTRLGLVGLQVDVLAFRRQHLTARRLLRPPVLLLHRFRDICRSFAGKVLAGAVGSGSNDSTILSRLRKLVRRWSTR